MLCVMVFVHVCMHVFEPVVIVQGIVVEVDLNVLLQIMKMDEGKLI